MFIFVWLLGFCTLPTYADTLSGSEWHISVADGHEYTFSFKPGGACTYMKKSPSGNEGKIYDNCSWQQNGNVIMFQTNNYYAIFLEK